MRREPGVGAQSPHVGGGHRHDVVAATTSAAVAMKGHGLSSLPPSVGWKPVPVPAGRTADAPCAAFSRGGEAKCPRILRSPARLDIVPQEPPEFERDVDEDFPSERPTLIEDVSSFTPGRTAKVVPRTRPLLTVLTGPEKGAVFSFTTVEATIGRSEDAEISIPDLGLSRIHAKISRKPGGYYLEDVGSTNGTFVDDVRIDGEVRLHVGSRFRLGQRTVLSLTLHDELEVDAALSMRQAAMRDRLTGIYNRGVFDDRLEAEIAFSARHGSPLSLLLFDVDHFKRFNDTFGHQAGDAVLIAVAEQVQKTVRTEDVLARYGGEEFAVIARDTPSDRALILGERIRRAIERAAVEHEGKILAVTASIGVATLSKQTPYDQEGLVSAADRSLYDAKQAGRNRVRHVDIAPSVTLRGPTR